MNKVKLPEEITENIETAWNFIKDEDKETVVKHLYLTNWTQLRRDIGETFGEKLMTYAKENPLKYMDALVNGYEIEVKLKKGDQLIYTGINQNIFGEVLKDEIVWSDGLHGEIPHTETLLEQGEVRFATEEEIQLEQEKRKWSEWGRKVNEWKRGDIFITSEYDFALIVKEVDLNNNTVTEFDHEEFKFSEMTMVCPVEMRQDSL